MKLLALVLLLAAFSSPTLTEVVGSFQQSCPSFFIRGSSGEMIIPTVFPGGQYKKICQHLGNAKFATLYDTRRRIPVYSAYAFTRNVNTQSSTWKIEPQLEDIPKYKDLTDMIESPREPGNIMNQAVDSDYVNSGYTRVHLFPNTYAASQAEADSTFTLTNTAPQTFPANAAWDMRVEQQMLKHLIDDCKRDQRYQAYVVTGVVPGNQWLPIRRNNVTYPNGINIPSHYWSAYCCTDSHNFRKRKSEAYIADMASIFVAKLSIASLNSRLTSLYGRSFSVFPGFDC